jgi:hypothetical protein
MELQAIQEHNIVLVMSFPTSGEAEMIILSFLYRRVGQSGSALTERIGRGMKQVNTLSNRLQYSSCSLKQTSKRTNAKESKQANELMPKKANKQTNRQATGMQNADGEEEEMRKVRCCKWAG